MNYNAFKYICFSVGASTQAITATCVTKLCQNNRMRLELSVENRCSPRSVCLQLFIPVLQKQMQSKRFGS